MQTPAAPRQCRPPRRAHQLVIAVVAMLLATALPALSTSGAAAPTSNPETAGQYAAGWLARQLDAGIPMQSFGSGDWGVTLDAAISLAATETGATQLDAVWAALVAARETVINPFGTGDQPGRLARIILLAHAIGEDPTAVGTGPGNDLVARLLATETTSGPDEGLFGDPTTQSPTYDGAFRQGYSLAALSAVGQTASAASTAWLENQQCPDGSWMPYRAEVAAGVLAPCAFDPVGFVGPDSNSTAAAINGLVYQLPASAAIGSGASWLATVQNADGGWGLFPGDPSEPSSVALVWQALVHAGNGTDPAYLNKSATPLQTLLSFQLGCTSVEADRGALTYPGSNDAPNTFSTAQATPALAGVPLVFGPVNAASTSPVVDCTVPTTTTTTTVTTTTTSTAVPSTTSTTIATTTTTTPRTSAPGSVAAAGAARPISFAG